MKKHFEIWILICVLSFFVLKTTRIREFTNFSLWKKLMYNFILFMQADLTASL